MANRTDPMARNIRGTNPQNLVETILRLKIYQNTYWKEQCFGLTAETLVDKAMEVDHLGGSYGGTRKPTLFMCLVTKMLQIQPEKDIVVEFIKNEDYKYVRILGAFYLRLTGSDIDIYRYLEPLYNDYRKLKMRSSDGKFSLTRVDVVIGEMLTKDYFCDIALPRIKKRWILESCGALEPRKSALEDDFEEEEKEDEDQLMGGLEEDGHEKDYYRERSPPRERERDRKYDSHRYRSSRDYDYDHDYEREYRRGRERGRDRDRDRDRDRYWERERGDRGYDDDHERDRRRRRSRSQERSRRRHSGGGERATKDKKDDGTDHPDPEIAEANRLRASLGMKPLK